MFLANVPAVKGKTYDTEADEESCRPLLGAAVENSIYLHNPGSTSSIPKLPALAPPPNATNPIYMSNNNGSPTSKKPIIPSTSYENIHNGNRM